MLRMRDDSIAKVALKLGQQSDQYSLNQAYGTRHWDTWLATYQTLTQGSAPLDFDALFMKL